MTRETKVGLLVGTGIILLIGIIVSDHLSVVQDQESAKLTEFAPEAQHQMSRGPASAPGVTAQELPVLPLPAAEQRQAPPAGLITIPASDTTQQVVSQSRSLPDLIPAGAISSEQVASTTRDPGSQFATELPRNDNQPAGGFIVSAQTTPPPLPEDLRVSTAQPVYYTVQRGDSLYSIARQFYGSGEHWRKIREANVNAVQPDGSVRQGVRLVIPDKGAAVTPQANASMTLDGVPITVAATGKAIKVESGDTLSSLASDHLGSAGRWKELYEANRHVLKDPDDLRAGMTLRLPAGTNRTAPTVETPRRASTPAQSATPRTYRVQTGDTLIKIAERVYGDRTRWRDIYNANRSKMRNPNDLRTGTELSLPARG